MSNASVAKIKPLHDRVLIERTDPPRQRIVIPEIAQEKSYWGVIVAVGPGRRNENGELVPMAVKPGDHVCFGKWNDWESIDERYILIREADIRIVLS